jgi:hypothetical protein
MDYRFFLKGVKNIMLNPSGAWHTIDIDNKPVKVIRDRFLMPLIILVSISAFAGSLLFINTELTPVFSVLTGLKTFIVLYCTVYLSSWLLGEITFPLDLGRDFSVSFNIVTFSFVPFFICQVFSNMFESLLFVNIIALYGLYIFWEGAEKFLNPPAYKRIPLLIAFTVSTVVIFVATNKLLGSLFERLYYAFFD